MHKQWTNTSGSLRTVKVTSSDSHSSTMTGHFQAVLPHSQSSKPGWFLFLVSSNLAVYLDRPVQCLWPLFLHCFYQAELQRDMMSSAKTELCTDLALRVTTAFSVLQDKQALPEVSPNKDKVALWVCVYVHMWVYRQPSLVVSHHVLMPIAHYFHWCPWTLFLWGKTEVMLFSSVSETRQHTSTISQTITFTFPQI